MASDMDVLVLENFILYKTEQPGADEKDKQRYVGSFSLD
jgi:hypothetical protein